MPITRSGSRASAVIARLAGVDRKADAGTGVEIVRRVREAARVSGGKAVGVEKGRRRAVEIVIGVITDRGVKERRDRRSGNPNSNARTFSPHR
jgi:hypothetical protein